MHVNSTHLPVMPLYGAVCTVFAPWDRGYRPKHLVCPPARGPKALALRLVYMIMIVLFTVCLVQRQAAAARAIGLVMLPVWGGAFVTEFDQGLMPESATATATVR